MAQKVRVEVETKERGSKKATKEIKDNLKDVQTSGKSFFKSFLDNNKTMIASFAKVGVAIYGVKQALDVMVGTLKAAELGATLTTQLQALNDLSINLGTNADFIIDKLREVSGGAVSTAALVNSAAKAMVLGIAPDKLKDLMQIAIASSKAMGTSVTAAFDDIVTGIARQSPMILDNLGITIKIGEAYENYAAKLGKTTEQLTETEKKQAFLNTTIDKGQQIVSAIGADTDDMRSSFLKLGAATENLTNALSKVLAPALEPIVKMFTNILNAITQTVDALDRERRTQKELADATKKREKTEKRITEDVQKRLKAILGGAEEGVFTVRFETGFEMPSADLTKTFPTRITDAATERLRNMAIDQQKELLSLLKIYRQQLITEATKAAAALAVIEFPLEALEGRELSIDIEDAIDLEERTKEREKTLKRINEIWRKIHESVKLIKIVEDALEPVLQDNAAITKKANEEQLKFNKNLADSVKQQLDLQDALDKKLEQLSLERKIQIRAEMHVTDIRGPDLEEWFQKYMEEQAGEMQRWDLWQREMGEADDELRKKQLANIKLIEDTQVKAHQKEMALLEKAMEEQDRFLAMTDKERKKWLEDMGILEDDVKKLGQAWQDAANIGIGGFTDAFTESIISWIDGTKQLKEVWGDAFKSMGAELIRLAIRLMIIKTLMSIPYGGGTLGGALGLVSGQGGGVFKGPQSGYPAVLHGTEAVIPLKGGKVPVDIGGAGAGMTIVNNVTVQSAAGQSDAEADRQGKIAGRAIEAEIKRVIMETRRPGGILNRGVA